MIEGDHLAKAVNSPYRLLASLAQAAQGNILDVEHPDTQALQQLGHLDEAGVITPQGAEAHAQIVGTTPATD